MEIRRINRGEQITLDLNVSNGAGVTQVQAIPQEVNTVEVGVKGSEAGSGQKSLSKKDVEKAVDKLNKLLEDKDTHVEYEVYGKFKDLTIRIVDDKTKEVVQELPPKKIIDMVNKLCELAGMFVDKKA